MEQRGTFNHEGIEVYESTPSTPTQNGGAEVPGKAIKTKGRSMIAESGLPKELASDIYRTAVYLTNPFSHFPQDIRPSWSHIGVFSCVAYLMTTDALEHIKSHKSMSPFTQRAHMDYLIRYKGESQYVIPVPSRLTKTDLHSGYCADSTAQKSLKE
ncbi:hypothetical protein EDB81DRAFT_765787 [Dactylonectria macrodidyma]|uniref:Uncharacterized protein n=1 Tax=Dactylonectria macrodidyma TaxID=307937 RepID=A0A9P9DS87_9HYPO|nr:hypothetical protein EDB81DRAFT_765787 [Dactylonectria macrodidyma]